MMHTEKFDISTNEKRLLHMIKGSKDPKAAADVAIDVIRAFLAPYHGGRPRIPRSHSG